MSLQISSDEELLAAVRLGDEKSFRALYDRYWGLIYRKAYSYIEDKEEAGNIVNDIFMSIWQNRETIQILSFPNYIKSATRYRVYNVIKAKKNQSVLYVENYDDLDQSTLAISNFQGNFAKEVSEHLSHLLASLPKRCQEIFLLSRVTHLSNSEIASKLDISKRSVENQLSMAVKHIKANLTDLTVIVMIFIYLSKNGWHI